MIENERLSKIINILETEQFCTTEYLANKLYVVPVTIRRDLKKLEQQGLINRCYGGASIITHNNRDVPFIVRKNSSNKTKSILAKEAINLIPVGSTVFLDASSTVSYIADLLTPEMELSVITNGFKTAHILSQKNITTFCTGGKIIGNSLSLVGSLATKSISSLHADILFFSSQGIDLFGNITDFSERETELRKLMIANSKKSYAILDSSKVGKTFLFSVCNIKDIDGFICDKKIDFQTDE